VDCIDSNHVLHLVVGNARKGSNLAETRIEEEDCDVDSFELVPNLFLVVLDVNKTCKIKDNTLGLDFVNFKILELSLYFGLGAANNAHIEASGSHLVANLEADAVTAASHDHPGVPLVVALVNVIGASQVVSLERAKKA
jgi:hypothetical protein